MLNTTEQERYRRQMLLKGFGIEGQQKLLLAKVLVIGAGGLGCPALQYLAAAGIGTIGVVDDDVVSLNNLHRQVLYTTEDIGFPKAERAVERLEELNPDIRILSHRVRLGTKNALNIIADYDIVIDGTDNFATRYLINDACALLGKPLVYAAVSQFEGQLAVFNVADQAGIKVNYRDLFPKPPKDGEIPNCAEAGVLGVLPGIMGAMQAQEVIKFLTGIGRPLINQLLTYNALANEVYVLGLSPLANAYSLPADEAAFKKMDYELECGFVEDKIVEIDAESFNVLVNEGSATVIDVREEGEMPEINSFEHLKIPLSKFEEKILEIEGDILVVFCQSGQRSRKAAKLLTAALGDSKRIVSLKGGVSALKNKIQ